MRLRRIAIHQRVREADLHGQRDELLLRTVVDVPFELARPLVLRAHDALSRGAELLDQSDVAEHETRLRGEIPNEAFLRRVHRIVRRHGHGKRSEQLSAIAHLDGRVRRERGEHVARQ